MKTLMKVEFDEVLAQFRLEHDANREHEVNTNLDSEMSLVLANQLLHKWSKVLLGREDILRVILPWHLSCGGNIHLVPKSGLSVEQAAKKLASMKDSYAQESPVCWSKIVRMSRLKFQPLFLSTQAITHEDYAELDTKKGLIHLDGLHRMIGWELHGLLADNAQVEAYVAGDLKFYA